MRWLQKASSSTSIDILPCACRFALRFDWSPFDSLGKLSIDDLQRVRTVTWDARAKWFDIGLALSIPAGTLDAVSVDKHDCGKCYTEMLTNWLKGVDPQPSWSALSDALKSTSVGCGDLAKQIATFQS